MRLQKSSFHSGLVLAALTASLLTARNAPPRRAPDVAYVPTTTAAVDAMLQLADVTASDTLYDLGCGDGRIVIAAASKRRARGVGIDIDPARVQEARQNARKSAVKS